MSLNFGFKSTGGSGSALTSLSIQNTLYVAKNGNDATALPDRLDLPYLTILAASQAATAGDVIYVFAGTYNEGFNDWVKSDVIYDFQEGAIVQNVWRCVSDFGLPKNVRIEGSAVFEVTSLNFSFGVIDFQNANSSLYLRCKDIIGISNGLSLNNMVATYDIKFRKVSTTNQYPINLRGAANTGRIEFDTIESLSSTVPILIRNCNTDGVRRNVFLKGRRLLSGVNAFSQASITFINALNTSLWCEIENIEHFSGSSGGLFAADSGFCFMYNTNATGVGYGFRVTGGFIGQVQNSNTVTVNSSISSQNNTSIFAKNSLFKCSSPSSFNGLGIFANTSKFTAKNCTFVHGGTSPLACILGITGTATKVNLASCILIGNPLNFASVKSNTAAPINIYIQEDCSSNLPVDTTVTNQVAGTNITVDSDIVQNTTNFF